MYKILQAKTECILVNAWTRTKGTTNITDILNFNLRPVCVISIKVQVNMLRLFKETRTRTQLKRMCVYTMHAGRRSSLTVISSISYIDFLISGSDNIYTHHTVAAIIHSSSTWTPNTSTVLSTISLFLFFKYQVTFRQKVWWYNLLTKQQSVTLYS